MAVLAVNAWQPETTPPGVSVRPALVDDVEILTELALEEHLYHAHHTTSGTSADQPRRTSRRIASEAVAAAADGRTCQLVAERSAPRSEGGAVVGSIIGTIERLGDDEITRYVLPARYGYIGLTSVTARSPRRRRGARARRRADELVHRERLRGRVLALRQHQPAVAVVLGPNGVHAPPHDPRLAVSVMTGDARRPSPRPQAPTRPTR
jgi:hypothetical protein